MTESARIAQGVVIHGLSSWMGPVELFAFIYLFTLDLERRARLVLGLFLTVLRETSVFPGWIRDDGLFAKRSALPFLPSYLGLVEPTLSWRRYPRDLRDEHWLCMLEAWDSTPAPYTSLSITKCDPKTPDKEMKLPW